MKAEHKNLTREQVHELRSSLGSVGMAVAVIAPAIPKEQSNFLEIIERHLANCLKVLGE